MTQKPLCTLLLILVSFLSHPTKAQTYYRSWGTAPVYEGGEAITKYGDDLIIGGTKNDSAFVMRLNTAGNIVWVKRFIMAGSAGRQYVNHLKVSNDGYIIGTGSGVNGSYSNGYYFKMDGAGNFIFLKGDNLATYFRGIYEKNSTEYLVFGARYSAGFTNTDIKVLTVSQATGNIVYQADMLNLLSGAGFGYTDDLEGSAKVSSNSYFSTGRIYLHPGADGMRPHLNKYDATGNVIWTKFLHKSVAGVARTYPQGMIYKNGYLYIPYASDEICAGGCSNYYPGLLKVDTLGNVVFDYTYNIPSSDGELTRGILTDGLNYYIFGYTNFNAGDRNIFVIKTDANGTLIQARTFGEAAYNENFLVSFIQPAYCDSSYIYITGSKNTGTANSDIFLMKIDTALNLVCGANSVTVNTGVVAPYSENMTPEYFIENIPMTNIASSLSYYIAESSICTTTDLTDTIYLSGVTVLNSSYPGATAYAWSTGSTSSNIVTSTEGTYTCTVSLGCCSFIHTFVVVDCDNPVTIDHNTPLCPGEPLNVSLGGYLYFSTDYNSSTFGGSSFSVMPEPGNNVFTIHADDGGGCSADTSFTYFLPEPDPVTFIDPAAFCPGDSVTIEATGSYSFTWNDGINVYTGPVITVLADVTHVYQVTGTNADGCTVDTTYTLTVDVCNTADLYDTVFLTSPVITLHATLTGATGYEWSTGPGDSTITVSMPGNYDCQVTILCCDYVHHFTVLYCPVNFGSVSGTDSLCQGETAVLTAGGGVSYTWNIPATGPVVNTVPTSTQTYTVMVFDAGGCSDTLAHTVQVIPLPLPPVVSDTIACRGDVLPQLQASGQNILWYSSAASTTGTPNAPFPNTNVAGIYDYFATQNVNGCESNKALLTVEILDIPVFSLNDTSTGCVGDTLMIGPVLHPAWQYTWSDLVNISPRPVINDGLYVLTTFNQCGNYSDSSQVVFRECECFFYLPNAFTPDADGRNEIFKPEYRCEFQEFVLRIFNRWGQLIFESEDPNQGWDGKHQGIVCKEDVYVVQVKYKAWEHDKVSAKEFRGHVTLLK